MSDFYGTPQFPTGGIVSLGRMIQETNIRDAVANFLDWQDLTNNAMTYAAFNAFGQLSVTEPMSSKQTGNYRVAFNKSEGFVYRYNPKSDFTMEFESNKANLAANLNGETGTDVVHPRFIITKVAGNGVFDTDPVTPENIAKALGLVNVVVREGLGFRVIGGITAGEVEASQCSFVFCGMRKENDAWYPECELMDSSYEGAPVFMSKIEGNDNGSVTIFLTDYAEFDGAAPVADDMITSQEYNYLQMFDATVGKGFTAESQSTLFYNQLDGLFKPLKILEYNKYDVELLFGSKGAIPTGGENRTDRGAMKGIWGMMNLEDPTKNSLRARPAVQVDYTDDGSLDFWNFWEFICQRPTDVNTNMLCIMPPKMYRKFLESMSQYRDLDRVSSIAFPKVPSGRITDIVVGDTTLHCVADKTLAYHPTFRDYNGNKADQGMVALILDMRYAGIVYQNNSELGLMIPQLSMIPSINDERKKRAHFYSCWTLGLYKKQMHAFYGLRSN